MSISLIVSSIRRFIDDETIRKTYIVDEAPAAAKLSTAPNAVDYWNETATGKNYEEFLTKNMPLVSGGKVLLRGDRWAYTYRGEFPSTTDFSADPHKRVFLIDYFRGMFIVPSGATPVPSGGRIRLTYSYWEDKEYNFSDEDIQSYIPHGYNFLASRLDTMPYALTGEGAGLELTPVPSGIHSSLLCLATSYIMRLRLFEESLNTSIFVRDGDTAFDTTKSLPHRGKSLDAVRKDLDAAIKDVMLGNLNAAGYRIDLYSTLDDNPTGIGGSQEYNSMTGDSWS